MWGATPQEGQEASGALPILSRKLLRDEQNPERSWARVVLWGRGREDSSSDTRGGGDRRTLLGDWVAMARATASVWRDLMVDL